MAPSNDSQVKKIILIKRKRDPTEQDQSPRPEKQQHSAFNASTQKDSRYAFLVGSTSSIGASTSDDPSSAASLSPNLPSIEASSSSDRLNIAASSSPKHSKIAAASSTSSGSDRGSSSSNRNWAPPTPASLSPVAAEPFDTRLESNANVLVNYNRLIITTYRELKRTQPHLATVEHIVGLFDEFAENALLYAHLGIDGIEAAILLYGLSGAPTDDAPAPVAQAQAPFAQAQAPATEAQAIPQQMDTPPGETQTLTDSQTAKSSHASGYNLRPSRAHRKGDNSWIDKSRLNLAP